MQAAEDCSAEIVMHGYNIDPTSLVWFLKGFESDSVNFETLRVQACAQGNSADEFFLKGFKASQCAEIRPERPRYSGSKAIEERIFDISEKKLQALPELLSDPMVPAINNHANAGVSADDDLGHSPNGVSRLPASCLLNRAAAVAAQANCAHDSKLEYFTL